MRHTREVILNDLQGIIDKHEDFRSIVIKSYSSVQKIKISADVRARIIIIIVDIIKWSSKGIKCCSC